MRLALLFILINTPGYQGVPAAEGASASVIINMVRNIGASFWRFAEENSRSVCIPDARA